MFLTQFNASERFFEKTKNFCERIRYSSSLYQKTKPPPSALHTRPTPTDYLPGTYRQNHNHTTLTNPHRLNCRKALPSMRTLLTTPKVKHIYIYLLQLNNVKTMNICRLFLSIICEIKIYVVYLQCWERVIKPTNNPVLVYDSSI